MKEEVRDLEKMAERIQALRKMRGWSPKEAYKACGIDKTTWNNYETATSRPNIDNAAAICEVFRVDLDFIYTGNTDGLSQAVLRALYGEQA